MISTCLIVKDEADYLPACLESLKGADEIVVVDTGSTDNTRRIASTYNHGDKARAACLQAIGTNPDFTEALSFMAEMTFQPLSAKWKRLAEQSTGHDVLFSR